MDAQPIEKDVRDFVGRHINSVGRLEVLLFLHRNAGKHLSAHEVARELRLSVAWVEAEMADLGQRGLLSPAGVSGARYCYSNNNPLLDRAVNGLERAYTTHRAALVSLIFSAPSPGPVQRAPHAGR